MFQSMKREKKQSEVVITHLEKESQISITHGLRYHLSEKHQKHQWGGAIGLENYPEN